MSTSPYFDRQPTITSKEIRSVYGEFLKDNELNLRPAYQRMLCWSSEQKMNLIDTIMSNCPMPNFLIYSYDGVMETIDGQHRLTTIKNYIDQNAPTEDNPEKPFPWLIEKDDSYEHVFFKETPQMKTYIDEHNNKKSKKGSINKLYRFMTKDEVSKFNKYNIVIQKIDTELTFEQRKEIFLRWQSGTGITQCERFKNEPYPYTEFIIEHNIQPNTGKLLAEYLKSGDKNWLFDLYRICLLFMSQTNEPTYSIISSLQARTKISSKEPFNKNTFIEAIKKLESFLNKFYFLKSYTPRMKLSTLMIISYNYFKYNNHDNKDIINEEFMKEFVESIFNTPEYKSNTLNNGPETTKCIEVLKEFEIQFISKLAQYKKPSTTYTKKKISDSLKTSVWNKYIGILKGESDCMCCNINKISPRDFHAGHVIAEVNNGATNVENLRPICSKCNLSMCSTNMKDFQKSNYPLAKQI